jgi:hypothetical protein
MLAVLTAASAICSDLSNLVSFSFRVDSLLRVFLSNSFTKVVICKIFNCIIYEDRRIEKEQWCVEREFILAFRFG